MLQTQTIFLRINFLKMQKFNLFRNLSELFDQFFDSFYFFPIDRDRFENLDGSG